ncbi:hypothetical protein CHU98_g995 [Xylaria longipes]|nr:hypothetical protein CHU98_g995 [Xylaria longipes]
MASLPHEPTYTVFIRLPFPRGDFVDPPPVNWESSKDEALWSIVSKLSKTEGTTCKFNHHHHHHHHHHHNCSRHTLTLSSAAKFEVTVDFLLQQVAWLTERHASQVRAQIRKTTAATKVSPAPSPQPQTSEGIFSADPPRYTGSATQTRAPSSTSIRKDAPLPLNEQNTPTSSMRSTPRPRPTRTSSTKTAFFTARNLGNSGGKDHGKSSGDAQRRRLTSLPITTNVDDQDDQDDQTADPQSPGPAESSSAASSSSSSSSSPAQSRIIRRPPRFQGNEGPSFANDDDDDDETEPAFLPYRPQAEHDLSATLRGNLRDTGKRSLKVSDRHRIHHSQTSDSSSGSTPVSRGTNDKRSGGPLSPRRTMESAGRSPGGKSKGYSRDSDGTPSMGSSFSDLDGTVMSFTFTLRSH